MREYLVEDGNDRGVDAGVDAFADMHGAGDDYERGAGYERETIHHHHDGDGEGMAAAAAAEEETEYYSYNSGEGEAVGYDNGAAEDAGQYAAGLDLGRTRHPRFQDEVQEFSYRGAGAGAGEQEPTLVEQPLADEVYSDSGSGGEGCYYPGDEEPAARAQEAVTDMYATESHDAFKPPSAWQHDQREPQQQQHDDGISAGDADPARPSAGLPSTVYDADFAPQTWNPSAMLESLRDTRQRAQQYRVRSHRSEITDRLRIMAVRNTIPPASS